MSHVSQTSLFVYDVSTGGLLNFDRDIDSVSLLSHSDVLSANISGRSVILLFNRADISDVDYFDMLLSFSDGTKGLTHCVLTFRDDTVRGYGVSASGDSDILLFPNSEFFNAGTDFSLFLSRSGAPAGWHDVFRCSFKSDSGVVDLVKNVIEQSQVTFTFTSLPHDVGRIELFRDQSILLWSFECSFD